MYYRNRLKGTKVRVMFADDMPWSDSDLKYAVVRKASLMLKTIDPDLARIVRRTIENWYDAN